MITFLLLICTIMMAQGMEPTLYTKPFSYSPTTTATPTFHQKMAKGVTVCTASAGSFFVLSTTLNTGSAGFSLCGTLTSSNLLSSYFGYFYPFGVATLCSTLSQYIYYNRFTISLGHTYIYASSPNSIGGPVALYSITSSALSLWACGFNAASLTAGYCNTPFATPNSLTNVFWATFSPGVPITSISSLCSGFTSGPYTGTFANFQYDPTAWTYFLGAQSVCSKSVITDIWTVIYNVPFTTIDDTFTILRALYFDSIPSTSAVDTEYGLQYAFCSWAYPSCTLTYSNWFIQSFYTSVPSSSWSNICSFQVSSIFTGFFKIPGNDPSLLSAISSIITGCSITNPSPAIAGSLISPFVHNYGLCSWASMSLAGSTIAVSTVTVKSTITSTFFDSSTSTTTTTTLTQISTSTNILPFTSSTTITSTIVESFQSVSKSTTTTTTTITSIRTFVSETETTSTFSFTITDTFTQQVTLSFTETVKTSGRSTSTRLITRTSCDPTLTTVTQTSFHTDTLTFTDETVVVVEKIVWITETPTIPSKECPPLTNTVCSISTVMSVITEVAFKRLGCQGCPEIGEAVLCASEPQDNGLVFLYNAVPFNDAECACKSIGKSLALIDLLNDTQTFYNLTRRCSGTFGNAWIQVPKDFTECYQVIIDGPKGYIVPAVSCDLSIPVICK